jgi:hypothetical protein
MQESHKRFTEKHGGQVFIVFSVKKEKVKEIANREIIEEIRHEIARLQSDETPARTEEER